MIKDIMQKLGKAIVAEYRRELREVGAIASGKLQRNTKYEVVLHDTTYQINLQLEDYWKIVEEGRRKGKFPPPSAIMKWIRVKPVIPKRGITLPQLTYVISKSIAKKGIPGRHPLRNALNNIMDIFDSSLDDIVQQVIQELENELDNIKK